LTSMTLYRSVRVAHVEHKRDVLVTKLDSLEPVVSVADGVPGGLHIHPETAGALRDGDKFCQCRVGVTVGDLAVARDPPNHRGGIRGVGRPVRLVRAYPVFHPPVMRAPRD